MSRRVRREISRRLPKSLLIPARRAARLFDQFCGRMSASSSPGRIVMLHIGRCGSTVLGNLLDQHPRIFWDGEIYFDMVKEAGCIPESFDNRDFLKRRARAAGSSYYGFDIKFLDHQHLAIAQSDLSTFVSDCLAAGVTHFIILRRENYLRTFISWVVGRTRNQHHISQSEVPRTTRVSIDPECFSFGHLPVKKPILQWFEHIDEAYARLREELNGQRVLELGYERDIMDDPFVAYKRCCEFLNIKEAAVEIQFARTNPFSVDQLLENPEEVRNALSGTPYAWMLAK